MAKEAELQEIKVLLGQLGDRVARLSGEVRDEFLGQSAENVDAIKDQLRERLAEAKFKAREFQKKAERFGRDTDAYAHENPWPVAAGAAAVGLLIGLVISSQIRNK